MAPPRPLLLETQLHIDKVALDPAARQEWANILQNNALNQEASPTALGLSFEAFARRLADQGRIPHEKVSIEQGFPRAQRAGGEELPEFREAQPTRRNPDKGTGRIMDVGQGVEIFGGESDLLNRKKLGQLSRDMRDLHEVVLVLRRPLSPSAYLQLRQLGARVQEYFGIEEITIHVVQLDLE
jgi:hypothetical protein